MGPSTFTQSTDQICRLRFFLRLIDGSLLPKEPQRYTIYWQSGSAALPRVGSSFGSENRPSNRQRWPIHHYFNLKPYITLTSRLSICRGKHPATFSIPFPVQRYWLLDSLKSHHKCPSQSCNKPPWLRTPAITSQLSYEIIYRSGLLVQMRFSSSWTVQAFGETLLTLHLCALLPTKVPYNQAIRKCALSWDGVSTTPSLVMKG